MVVTSAATNPTTIQDLLTDTVRAVEAAGDHLAGLIRLESNLRTRADFEKAICDGDQESLNVLRPQLERARPGIGWVEDELGDGPLPPGEWWLTDPVEGAINYVHGLPEWGVTATLVSDNRPVLTVVHLPLAHQTYTATVGGGAFRNTERLRVSNKVELAGALVGTGQASPRETDETFARIGRSLVAMMPAAGVTRSSVPPTLQLVTVADGRTDVFFQYSAVRSGLLAGALLVQEAGGVLSDIGGGTWSLDSSDFVAAAPGVHADAVTVLRSAR